jgi:hypothetical protein
MRGITTKQTALAIEKTTRGMNNFVSKIAGRHFVIDAITWHPINGGEDQSISATEVSPESEEYKLARKATPEEQALVDQVKWELSPVVRD